MAAKGRRNFSAAEALELVFADEDSDNANFDCGSDLEVVPDSEDSGDSDLESRFCNLQVETDDNVPSTSENIDVVSGDYYSKFVTQIL